jgi:hypothetical protein
MLKNQSIILRYNLNFILKNDAILSSTFIKQTFINVFPHIVLFIFVKFCKFYALFQSLLNLTELLHKVSDLKV